MICPHCKTNNLMREGKKRTCLSCGKEVKSPSEQHKFIQLNEKEIIEDYNTIGSTATIKKWGIGSSTLYELKGAREVMKQKHFTDKDNHSHLPKMPEFSNEWTSDVQLKWLEIYLVLLDKK